MPRKKTQEEVIARFREVHGDKFDYSKVEYENMGTKVYIICHEKDKNGNEHGGFWQEPRMHLSGHGCNKCSIQKHMTDMVFCGVIDKRGIDSESDKKPHQHWKEMIKRCYDPNNLKRHPTYNDCYVCDEWLVYSNFKSWFDENYVGGHELDKDILVKGNKVYSPDTCCFIPHEINTLLLKRQNARGDYPIGVYYDKTRNKYASGLNIRGKRFTLGRFLTPEEAFQAYKNAKEACIKKIANEYYSDGRITKRVYDALMRYEVEITD